MTPILRTESCPPDPVRTDSAWAAHSRPRSNHDDLESPWSIPVPPAPRLRVIALPQVSPLLPVVQPATPVFPYFDPLFSVFTYPPTTRFTCSTCPVTGPNAMPLGYDPDSPILSASGSAWSLEASPSSPIHTTASSLLVEPSLSYTPLSPRLTPPTPGHNGTLPRYTTPAPPFTDAPLSLRQTHRPPAFDRVRMRSSVPSPTFKQATPQLPPPSPLYIPPTPAYSLPSPEYTPSSPAYSPPSPVYDRASPAWSPPSPSPGPRTQPLPLLFTTGICPTPKLHHRQSHHRRTASPATSPGHNLPLLYNTGSFSTPRMPTRLHKRITSRPADPNAPLPMPQIVPSMSRTAPTGLHSVPMVRSRASKLSHPTRRGPPAFIIKYPLPWAASKSYHDVDEAAFGRA